MTSASQVNRLRRARLSRRSALGAVSAAAAATVLAGCGPKGQGSSSGSQTGVAQGRAQPGGVITAVQLDEPISFDPSTKLAASARGTGTDADVIHLSRSGVPTGSVSIALRYMHSPVEMVQLDDIAACARLIAAFAQSLGPATSFAR